MFFRNVGRVVVILDDILSVLGMDCLVVLWSWWCSCFGWVRGSKGERVGGGWEE